MILSKWCLQKKKNPQHQKSRKDSRRVTFVGVGMTKLHIAGLAAKKKAASLAFFKFNSHVFFREHHHIIITKNISVKLSKPVFLMMQRDHECKWIRLSLKKAVLNDASRGLVKPIA